MKTIRRITFAGECPATNAVLIQSRRRPGAEQQKHLPALWPVTPSAGHWGGTGWLDTHAALDRLNLEADPKVHVLDLWTEMVNPDGTLTISTRNNP